MLYHWYELDLNSARAGHRPAAGHRLHDITSNYDARAAARRSRGNFFRSSVTDLGLIAANDAHPDAQAISLREAGLGRICQFDISTRRSGLTYNVQQINGRLWYALCVVCCSMLSAMYFVRHWGERHEPLRSHKMVANGTEQSTDASYGAYRQRFQRSIEKQAK